GVAAGAWKPVHSATSMPGAPASASVGTSGHDGWRAAAVTASARTLPAFNWPTTGGGSAMVKVTCPEMTALTDSPLLLYGMCVKWTPVFWLKSSLASWNGAALEA